MSMSTEGSEILSLNLLGGPEILRLWCWLFHEKVTWTHEQVLRQRDVSIVIVKKVEKHVSVSNYDLLALRPCAKSWILFCTDEISLHEANAVSS